MSGEEVQGLDEKLRHALELYYGERYAQALPAFREVAAAVETMDIILWAASGPWTANSATTWWARSWAAARTEG